MPLQPAEKTALALWLTAARHLDPECCTADDDAGRNLLSAARGILHSGARSAAHYVKLDSAITGHLQHVAGELASLLAKTSTDMPEVQAAEKLLRELARDAINWNGSGDSQAVPGDTGDPPSSCGVLALAGLIETRVRGLIEKDTDLPCGKAPTIVYVTAFTNNDYDIEPFHLKGTSNIKLMPRTVTLVLTPEEMTCRDLCHLAYTLHHELVCHAFQGALATGLPNAHASCHWTEGWVDTLAFDLIRDWVLQDEAPRNWLPMRGDDAVGELWAFHNHRYVSPRELRTDQVMGRCRARAAYRRLVKTLSESGIAASPEEAQDIVRRFTLSANAHPDADCIRLSSIGSKLRYALLSVARPQAAPDAAAACLAFSADHDLPKLERALDAVA